MVHRELGDQIRRLFRARGLGHLTDLLELAGNVNRVLRCRSSTRGRVVVRINVRDPKEEKWEHEEEIYALIRRVAPDIAVPRVLLTDSTREIVPWPVQVTRCIEGLPGDSAQVDASKLPHAALGRLIARLHAIAVPYFGWPHEETANSAHWPAYMASIARKAASSAADSGLLTAAQQAGLEALLRREHSLLARQQPRTPVLVHGDLHWGNVLLAAVPDGYAITGLIDFEWALGADPLYEWALATRPIRHSQGVLSAYREETGRHLDTRLQAYYRVVASLHMLGALAQQGTRGAVEGHLRILRAALRCASQE